MRNNRDNFKGEVYEPFILCGNVPNPAHAIYIENTVAARDLTIFFFEEAEDMNQFLNQTRGVMKLERVGAAQLPRRQLDCFTPNVPGEQLQQYGLVDYLRDMVQAPDKVLAYMCQQVSSSQR